MDSLLARRLLLIFLVAFVTAVPFVYSQNPLYVSVATNKTQFSPGETVSISGQVRNSQNSPVSDVLVSVQVNNPQATPVHVELLYSSESGTYSDNLVLPSNSAEGLYAIFVSASKPGFDNGQAQAQFNIVRLTTSTSSRTSFSSQATNPPGRCFIATATYGSELAPEVALLRNFRDTQVLQTQAGRSFMRAFNGFYYSFSPQVASIISSSNHLRAVMKGILYPLVGVLYISHELFGLLSFNHEVAATISGIFAAFGIGFIYMGPIFVIPFRLFRRPRLYRLALTPSVYLAALFSLVMLFLAELSHVELLLSSATVSLVLSSLILGIIEFPA